MEAALWMGSSHRSEANFALFFGLAIQAYETTLVSDNTRLDQFLEGNQQALSVGTARPPGVPKRPLAVHAMSPGGGVHGRFFQQRSQHSGDEHGSRRYRLLPNRCVAFARGHGPWRSGRFRRPLFAASQTRAAGTFKSPGLRNVEFTGPYFHNGGQATLEQVVQFYARNGDFPAGGNLGPGIGQIALSAADQTALVAFLKTLSDDRVRYEQAPFDHPSLCVSTGGSELSPGVLAADTSDPRFSFSAAETFALIPSVGKGGNSVALQTFEELLAGTGSDGSRAHSLRDLWGGGSNSRGAHRRRHQRGDVRGGTGVPRRDCDRVRCELERWGHVR